MSPHSQRVGSNSIQENVYLVLKKNIAQLKLAPGTAMSTQEIAERLNVSRTPVREAFIRLQKEGLVEIAPQKGTNVSRIDLIRVEKERFIRESLELAVISLFLNQYTEEDVQRLEYLVRQQKACFAEKNSLDFISYDDLFHKVFFDTAGQDLSWETIISSNSHYNRLRVLTVQNMETFESALRQHEVLLQLMKQKDAEGMKRELRVHVQKINIEKTELQKNYPDFFAVQPSTPAEFITL